MNYCRKCRLSDERFWRKFLSSLKLKLVYARGFLLFTLMNYLKQSCEGVSIYEKFVHEDFVYAKAILIRL